MSDAIKFCEHCGAANRDVAQFCSFCGTTFNNATAAMSKSSTPPASIISTIRTIKQRYTVVSQIGQGGFGTIYQAQDQRFPLAPRAIKEINWTGGPHNPSLQEAIEAFKQEAEILSSLMHPNLPRIYDYFEENGSWYLVMDYIEGQTLDELIVQIPDGKFPIPQVLTIAIQLCTVLGYLHSQQPAIIFRDLKPGNVMLTSEDHLYLIDFGIARLFKPGKEQDTVALGSPGYAAPEQYGKAQTTVQADIYSLGATIHHLISGHDPSVTPFTFPSLQLEVYGSSGTELANLINRMVNLDKEQRPTSVQSIKKDLLHLVGQSWEKMTRIPAPPASTNAASRLRIGEIVEARITSIETDGVRVMLAQGKEARLPKKEYTDKTLRIGTRIQVCIIAITTRAIVVSSKRVQSVNAGWAQLSEHYQKNDLIKGTVRRFNRGGIHVTFHGLAAEIQGFIPLSHIVSIKKADDENEVQSILSSLRGKELILKILECEQEQNRLLLSERLGMQEWRQQRMLELIDELQPEEIRTGIISGVKDFGAFVDIGGAEGLVHISNFPDPTITHPGAVVSEGQPVQVRILRIDKAQKRIALALLPPVSPESKQQPERTRTQTPPTLSPATPPTPLPPLKQARQHTKTTPRELTGKNDPATLEATQRISIDHYLQNGKKMLDQDQYKQAIQHFKNAIKLDSTNKNSYYYLGLAYQKNGEYNEALQAFKQTLLREPTQVYALLNKGHVLFALQRFEDALTAYEETIKVSPQFAEAYMHKGNACAQLQRYDEALDAYDYALQLEPQAERYIAQGEVLEQLSLTDEALDAYNHAIRADTYCIPAYNHKGNLLFNTFERYQEAFFVYERALKLAPDNVELLLSKALALKYLGRNNDLPPIIQKILSIDPYNKQAQALQKNTQQ